MLQESREVKFLERFVLQTCQPVVVWSCGAVLMGNLSSVTFKRAALVLEWRPQKCARYGQDVEKGIFEMKTTTPLASHARSAEVSLMLPAGNGPVLYKFMDTKDKDVYGTDLIDPSIAFSLSSSARFP
ncbi:hypothetical protein TWF594_007276 [Orbilia oligospora]|nr:hypothetical protein TWF594_007276 [Orbilia oligospora]